MAHDAESQRTSDPLSLTQVFVEESMTAHLPPPESPPLRPPSPAIAGAKPTEQRPATFGRYRVIAEAGQGGFGTVFVGHDETLDRPVAIKVPQEKRTATQAVEFIAEARRLAQLHHPGILAIHDFGEQDGRCYIVTEYLEGTSLKERLRHSRPGWQEAVELVARIADALAHAHMKSMIHRDLKPANIMITTDGRPVILDFGLALTDLEATGDRDLVAGTPPYMSPEQTRGQVSRIDGRSDIYSLAVVLYQLICGRVPFRANTLTELFEKIRHDEPQPMRQLNPDIPAALEEVCLKALSKKQHDRYTTASDFAAALRQITAPKPAPESHAAGILLEETIATGDAAATADSSSQHTPRPNSQSVGGTSQSRRRREAERRQLTLLSLSFEVQPLEQGGALDSDSQHELASEFAVWCRECITAFGGRDLPTSGQSVTACFGYPQAYEDAPQRAVRTALRFMQELAEWNERVARSLGAAATTWAVVHTGDVVAEERGEEDSGSISLVGDASTILARLELLVPAGAVTITAATRRLVAGFFETEPAGSQQIRGVSAPVELFRVTKAAPSRNRVELTDPGNLTPLVGRDTELSILKDRWEQTQEGLGQVVLLIGDAGLGKSRLIREIREHVDREDFGERPAVIEFRCSAYHQNTGLFPATEYLNRLLDFDNTPDPPLRLKKLTGALAELDLDSAQNVALLTALLTVPLGPDQAPLDLSPQKQRELTHNLLHVWLARLAQQRPVLFIVEDLHWVDPSTLEFLGRHVEQFESGRLLSVLTFRPEFETPWKSKPHQTQLALNRLTRRQIAEIMKRRTSRRDIPDVLVDQIVARTDGVPLFIEEFTNLIMESGVLDRPANLSESVVLSGIPASLQDLLVARLERMASNPEVAQLASAIGREFTFHLLSAVCELPAEELAVELEKLVRAELLFQKGTIPDASFIFKHALIQDSAYHSLVKKRRQQFHLRIAEVLERQFPEVAATQPELLAQHFSEAGAIERGVDYWARAGQRSQSLSAHREAINQFQKGLDLLLQTPPSAQRDRIELGVQLALSASLMAARGYSAPEVEGVLTRARTLCEQLGDSVSRFYTLWGMWAWRFIREDLDQCHGLAQELVAMAQVADDRGQLAEAHFAPACSSFYLGQFADAATHGLAGFACWEEEPSLLHARFTGQNAGVGLLCYAALPKWYLGFPDQALRLGREAVSLLERLNHPLTSALGIYNCTFLLLQCRLTEEARAMAQREIALSTQQGFPFWNGMGALALGAACLQAGECERAVELLSRGLTEVQATGARVTIAHYYGCLAEALWRIDRREPARETLTQGFAHIQSTNSRFAESELLALQAEFEWDASPAAAEGRFQEALAVARRQGARSLELRIILRMIRLRLNAGTPGDSPRLLADCLGWFQEGLKTPELVSARALLTSLS
ncbi:MAG: protein kinase domain-containing protein [Planctomycetales bacterium]